MNSIVYYPKSESQAGFLQEFTSRGQCDCDCDCACVALLETAVVETGSDRIWRKASNVLSLPISTEYKVFLSPLGKSAAVLNSQAYDVLNSMVPSILTEQAPQGLEASITQSSGMVYQLASLGLLEPFEHSDCACISSKDVCHPAESTGSPLVAWLHVTDRCNLRCSYCYLPHVCEDMSPETGRAAIAATFRSALAHDFKQVKLKYAGGEPLLHFPFLVELHSYAQSLADKHHLNLEGVILSNGTLLTNKMVGTLKSLGLRLMVSLDGFGMYHDRHRPYAGGRGSFQDVAEAVDLALANAFVPNISVTVSSRTAEGLPEALDWILTRQLPFSLNFYRENELSASHQDMRLDEEKIVSGMLAAFKVIENNLPKRSFLGGIMDRTNFSLAHSHTCGVSQNYLVFDQNGQVAKCQMQIRKPVTNIYVADPLTGIRADQTGIQNVSVEEKEGCKWCEWRYWCTGGCPLETYRTTGRYDVRSPNCNIYKALFPEALRLEGLRLLKYRYDPEVVVQFEG